MGTRGVVIGNVAMEYVGEDEGGGTVANNDGVRISGKRPDGHALYVDDARSGIHGSDNEFDMAGDFKGTRGNVSRFVETDESRVVVNDSVIMSLLRFFSKEKDRLVYRVTLEWV